MADIQQWRRKIHHTRSRTPATPAVDTEDLEDDVSTATPKRKLKPKLSSYFGHTVRSSLHDEAADTSAELPSWPHDQFYPSPSAEELMDTVMCKLMADPFAGLEPCHNSSLMLICESYLELKDEKYQLQCSLNAEMASTQTLIARFNMAEKDFEDDRQDYKEEVKRLEVLLAKASQRGVAEVTLARQDSKLYDHRFRGNDRKETIFEFLEKTKRPEDEAWSNQRATMKPLLQSPSDKDKHMSQRLAQKKSMTNIHSDLPFGTPPRDTQFSLTGASLLERGVQKTNRKRAVAVSDVLSTSDDTFSTFSCDGDLLPDETPNATATEANGAGDFASIEHIADALARRRNIEPARLMPQLLDLFGVSNPVDHGASSTVTMLAKNTTNHMKTTSIKAGAEAPPSLKHRTVMSKASGFFQKLKPQMTTEAGAWRRFSFEPGDDTASGGAPPYRGLLYEKDRRLRKAVSADALNGSVGETIVLARSLSPVPPSPTVSPSLGDGRPPSRIPTPVFSSGSLARPRQEREDSASSLLTVIKHAENAYRGSPRASSIYSSPSASRDDMCISVQPSSLGMLRSNSSNRLLDHTSALRGSCLTSAAARIASVTSETDWKHSSTVGQLSADTELSDMINVGGQRENIRPRC